MPNVTSSTTTKPFTTQWLLHVTQVSTQKFYIRPTEGMSVIFIIS